MAQKKVSTFDDKKKLGAPKTQTGIPKGFNAVSGVNVPAWDFDKNAIFQGVVLNVKDVHKGGKILSDTRVMTAKDDDGNVWAIWESALLGDLFDQSEAGDEVYMQLDGYEPAKKANQSDTKMFTTGIKKK